VCRGLQVLNVALGGTLHQHLPDVVGSTVHCPTVGQFSHHRVATLADSRLATIIGSGADVQTHHHQALDRIAPELQPTAWAEDGIVEAVESQRFGWVVGVQWHPEVDGGEALFSALVTAAAEYRSLSELSSPA
jgi:gamma-glutamyl-gamma-aminobutyrate hydrolase PuuD